MYLENETSYEFHVIGLFYSLSPNEELDMYYI